MRRGPIGRCKDPKIPALPLTSGEVRAYWALAPVSRGYSHPSGRLPTCYSPVRRSVHRFPPEGVRRLPALDLHVLGTPPAFVLSQDQTLRKKFDAAASVDALKILRFFGALACLSFSKNDLPLKATINIISTVLHSVNDFFKKSWWSLAGSNR